MTKPLQQVFVIRVWLEDSDGAAISRGYIEHAASGERRYFTDPADAVEYVAAVGRVSVARNRTAKTQRA